MLELDDVRARRGERVVLDGASLSLDAGVAALVGVNGSGKTTLLRVAAGLLAPERGRALVAGRPAERLPARERARLVGWLPQRAQDAFLAATLREELARAGATDADAALRAVGLAERADRHPLALSEGERRRAAFAVALAASPPLLLLDEPTAGLDAGAAQALLARLDARGGAALVATHDPDLALACDRVLVLADGRVHDAGSPAEFAASAWPARVGWSA